MNILVSVNKKYVRYLLVLMASVYVNHPGESITFYVLGKKSELDEDASAQIIEYAESWKQNAVVIHVPENQWEGFRVTSYWSVETYFRLLAHKLLPTSLERILYLDVDIVVDRNIIEYYHTDFGSNYLVACRLARDTLACLDGASEENHSHFNAGQLLINLPLFRENITMQTYKDYIASHGESAFLDEAILNGVFQGKAILKKPYDYNCYPAFYSQYVRRLGFEVNPYVIHYVGRKPWDYWDGNDDLQGRWWHYAKLTPHYEALLEEMAAKREYLNRVRPQEARAQEIRRLKAASGFQSTVIRFLTETALDGMTNRNFWNFLKSYCGKSVSVLKSADIAAKFFLNTCAYYGINIAFETTIFSLQDLSEEEFERCRKADVIVNCHLHGCANPARDGVRPVMIWDILKSPEKAISAPPPR